MKKAWIILLLLACGTVCAQDIHFSQFFATPMFTNPAFTGLFKGTYRFSGAIRNQWLSISPQPYTTFGGAAEMNAPFNLKPLGAGLHLAQDQAGASSLTRQQANLFISGRFRAGASKDITLAVGALVGFSNQHIDYSQLQFDRQFDGSAFNPDLSSGESFAKTSNRWVNLGAGLYLEKRFTERKFAGAGLSAFNLLRPDVSYIPNPDGVYLPSRQNIHAMVSLPFAPKWDVLPALQYMWQKPHSEFLLGSSVRYHLKNTALEQESILLGLWGRPRDAGYVSAGVQWNNLFMGASYDVNLSSLQTATLYRGGWEITIVYILETVREKVKRTRQCPDYI